MRNNRLRNQTYEQWRQSLLDDTARFIEWGLRHPENVEWIPQHPVGKGAFPERLKNIFWTLVLNNTHIPD
jgi:hypothetical protein